MTKSKAFLEVLLFLEGPVLLKLQLVDRDFYRRIVPEFFDKEDCPLTLHVDLFGSLILKDPVSVRSLKIGLGNHKIKENLWRGSRDGFGADQFHERCDEMGKTLTVVKTERGSVFGGYTDISWTSPFPS